MKRFPRLSFPQPTLKTIGWLNDCWTFFTRWWKNPSLWGSTPQKNNTQLLLNVDFMPWSVDTLNIWWQDRFWFLQKGKENIIITAAMQISPVTATVVASSGSQMLHTIPRVCCTPLGDPKQANSQHTAHQHPRRNLLSCQHNKCVKHH